MRTEREQMCKTVTVADTALVSRLTTSQTYHVYFLTDHQPDLHAHSTCFLTDHQPDLPCPLLSISQSMSSSVSDVNKDIMLNTTTQLTGQCQDYRLLNFVLKNSQGSRIRTNTCQKFKEHDQCCANIRNFESNRIITSVFDSSRNKHNYSKFSNTYRHRFFYLLSSRLTDYWQNYQLPVALFNYRLYIYHVKHACAHAQHVFDLCRRSHQRQTPLLSLPAPHLCSGRGRGGDAYTQSKCQIRAAAAAGRERNRASMAQTLIT